MDIKHRHRNTSISLLNYHFVWIPRRRRKVLKGNIESRLRELLIEKSIEIGLLIVALEIMPDHIHLFVNAPPNIAPDQIVFRLKGYTAHTLRKEFEALRRMPSMWTRSYFVSTAGNVSSDTIQRYIENQKKT